MRYYNSLWKSKYKNTIKTWLPEKWLKDFENKYILVHWLVIFSDSSACILRLPEPVAVPDVCKNTVFKASWYLRFNGLFIIKAAKANLYKETPEKIIINFFKYQISSWKISKIYFKSSTLLNYFSIINLLLADLNITI